jgi:hypothetical protein
MSQASQIKITSIESSWTKQSIVDPTGANGNLTGDGTNEIRWGTPFPGSSGQQSGFKFQQTAQGTTQNSDTDFNVGVFTHMNRVIYQNQYLESAQLNMTVKAMFDGVERTFVTSYLFTLWETPNLAQPCANKANNWAGVNQSGCADRVQLLENNGLTDKFVVNGLTYEFELFGFDKGAEFWTIEDRDNPAWLRARFNVSGFPPPPSVVPLPAGAWLLLGGLGGLALLRRRAARR